MAKANQASTTSRRTLLSAGPAILLAVAPVAATPTAQLDAELIGLVEMAVAREDQCWALTAKLVHVPDDVQAQQDCILEELGVLVTRIQRMPACGLDGVYGKAKLLRHFLGALTDTDALSECGDQADRIAFSLIDDLMRLQADQAVQQATQQPFRG